MKLILNGVKNKYYVQTLCMVFFPGTKFGIDAAEEEGTPTLVLNITRENGKVTACAKLSQGANSASAEKTYSYTDRQTQERTDKIAIGAAVMSAGESLLSYRPSWGILTGVRPSKVAMEILQMGFDAAGTREQLTEEYFVNPKKASLAVDVAVNEQRLMKTPGKKDCSVYLSIPFCPTRCSYCSFVSYTSARLLSLIPQYLERLEDEVRVIFDNIHRLGLNLKTVYIGGGTPTVLTAAQLQSLLSTVAACTDVSALEEYTLESGRPDTITAEKFALAREYGVTRVSVNPQSLCDEVLQQVGRCHSVDEFYRAYQTAKDAGFRAINTDLIAGLPGDNFARFSDTFDKILQLEPENITVHTLCVKKSAEMRRRGGENVYSLRGGETGKCVDYSQIKAMHEGYIPYYMYRQKNTVGNYENVGFAKPGTEGLYNIYMMEEVHSIFAAGAGAVTKLVEYEPQGGGAPLIHRLFHPKYPYEYLREENLRASDEEIECFYRERGIIQ